VSRFDTLTVEATVRPTGVVLQVESCELTIDEAWSPYGQARLVCRTPIDRDSVDLRAGYIEVDLQLLRAFGRSWNLGNLTDDNGGTVAGLTTLLAGQPLGALTNTYFEPFGGSQVRSAQMVTARLPIIDRSIDDETGQLALTLATGEALLQADALVSPVPSNPGTTSLRTIISSVLTRYGAVLAAAPAEATVAEAEATIWTPGVTAWAYLQPMLEAASLRLWCDLDGTWYLTPRQTDTEGSVSLAVAQNVTQYVDRMSLDPEVWADAVVIEYKWTDALDLQRTEYDVAGANPSRACLRIERQAVFPGPGAAAGILNRAQGRGRTLEVSSTLNLTARPGMGAQITPIAGQVQTGVVSAITWQAPESRMTVSTRGLVDTPATAYIFGPPGTSYLDVPVGISYTEFEWSLL
jgi:hypothetical protein